MFVRTPSANIVDLELSCIHVHVHKILIFKTKVNQISNNSELLMLCPNICGVELGFCLRC